MQVIEDVVVDCKQKVLVIHNQSSQKSKNVGVVIGTNRG